MTASFIPSLLKELDDVTITTPAVGHGIRYDGSKWINQQLSHLDLTNVGVNTHVQIDSHIASAANPHGVSLTQQDIRIPVGGTLWMGTTNPSAGAGDVFVIHKSYNGNQLMTLRNTHAGGISGIRLEDELGIHKGWLGYFNDIDFNVWNSPIGLLFAASQVAISPDTSPYLTGFASRLTVDGNCAIGNAYRTTLAPANGLIVEGNVGIGTLTPDTRLDIEDGAISFLAMTAPASPVADKAALYVTATGTTPSRVVALKAKFQNGTEVTLASVTV